jgi:glycosyltransferase involved in cell wall biosynthesis
MSEINKKHPLVSVVVPCYNHEGYVKECIQSIIDQSYKNIELIVIDDGSKDASVAVIEELRGALNLVLEKIKGFVILLIKHSIGVEVSTSRRLHLMINGCLLKLKSKLSI